MAKKVKAIVTLQINAGQGQPAPPIGPALAQHGINLMAFCKEYNALPRPASARSSPRNHHLQRRLVPLRAEKPPSTFLIMKAAGIDKGSPVPQSQKVGKVTRKQLAEIAEVKRKDMNTQNVDAIIKQLEGTALQMGVEVTD